MAETETAPWMCRWFGHRVELNRCIRCGKNLGVKR